MMLKEAMYLNQTHGVLQRLPASALHVCRAGDVGARPPPLVEDTSETRIAETTRKSTNSDRSESCEGNTLMVRIRYAKST